MRRSETHRDRAQRSARRRRWRSTGRRTRPRYRRHPGRSSARIRRNAPDRSRCPDSVRRRQPVSPSTYSRRPRSSRLLRTPPRTRHNARGPCRRLRIAHRKASLRSRGTRTDRQHMPSPRRRRSRTSRSLARRFGDRDKARPRTWCVPMDRRRPRRDIADQAYSVRRRTRSGLNRSGHPHTGRGMRSTSRPARMRIPRRSKLPRFRKRRGTPRSARCSRKDRCSPRRKADDLRHRVPRRRLHP